MYERVISLGWFCGPALEMKRIGLRDGSYPFDLMLTHDFSKIISMIERGERFHFYHNEMFQYPDNASKWYNSRYTMSSFHDFSAQKKLETQLEKVEEKYERRAVRFYNAICKKTVFLRYIKDKKELQYILLQAEKIEQILKTYHTENIIIYIANMELKSLVNDGLSSKIYFVDPDEGDTVNRAFLLDLPKLQEFLLKNVNPPISHYQENTIRRTFIHFGNKIQGLGRQVKNSNRIHQEDTYETVDDEIILFHKKSECSGCGACQAICPQNTISMHVIDGFYYPVINRKNCIKCKRCIEICPFK